MWKFLFSNSGELLTENKKAFKFASLKFTFRWSIKKTLNLAIHFSIFSYWRSIYSFLNMILVIWFAKSMTILSFAWFHSNVSKDKFERKIFSNYSPLCDSGMPLKTKLFPLAYWSLELWLNSNWIILFSIFHT